MWTVTLLRGPKPPRSWNDETERRAWQRADAQLDLHGLNTSKLTTDAEKQAIVVDASSYYGD
jgi:hypothetical protein